MHSRVPKINRLVISSLAVAVSMTLTACGNKSFPENRGLLFRSSGNPLMFVDTVDGQTDVVGYNGSGKPELSPGALPGDWGVYTIPTHSGVNVIRFAGNATGAGDNTCVMKAYSTNIPIDSGTQLSYWIFPQQENAKYVGVDLHCTDGTLLSSTHAVDQNNASMDPSEGHGGNLSPRIWSQVQCQAGKWLDGKTVDQILITYHHSGAGGQYRGYVDDISLSDSPVLSRSQIVTTSAPASPNWVKNAVIYGINTRQFSPAGNLAGVASQLDRLHSLGATVLWLLPINTPGKLKAFGSPYCVQDYYAINPAYGTAADLHKVVDGAHKRGMKVILDLPLDHTSWDNALISQHPDWYRHDDGAVHNAASISRSPMWPDVAQLDYSNQPLHSYMIDMEKHWLTTFNLDGFRYDSAELVPTEFWNESSTALRAVKPDVLLLGESHRPETMMKAFDVDYSFTLYPQLADAMKGKEPAMSIPETLKYEMYQFPKGALHMRYAGNQDTDKPAALFGPNGAQAAAVLTFTMDGVPLIYNGQEVGDAAPGNFISAPPIKWTAANQTVDALYTHLAALRRQHPALVEGTTTWIGSNHPNQVAGYVRSDGKETIVVAVNLANAPMQVTLPLKAKQTLTDITPVTTSTKGIATPVSQVLGPYGFRIYKFTGSLDKIIDTNQYHPI